MDLVYPVGSIYQSTSSTSPAEMFGGTWVQVTDKFLKAGNNSLQKGGMILQPLPYALGSFITLCM